MHRRAGTHEDRVGEAGRRGKNVVAVVVALVVADVFLGIAHVLLPSHNNTGSERKKGILYTNIQFLGLITKKSASQELKLMGAVWES